jgi:DNA-binding NtrC family response regulator
MQDHILVVEDEAIIRTSLRRLLVRNGYTVTEAESVADARQHDFDSFALIISDLRLPCFHAVREPPVLCRFRTHPE